MRGSHVDDSLVDKGPAAIIGNLVTVILVMCHRRTNERRPGCCEHEERRWIVPVASVLAVAFLVARVCSQTLKSFQFPDSASFLERATADALDSEYFIGSGRFFAVPLVYKVSLRSRRIPSSTHRLAVRAVGRRVGFVGDRLCDTVRGSWLGLGAFTAVLTWA